jgi:hypothetical protein
VKTGMKRTKSDYLLQTNMKISIIYVIILRIFLAN